MTGWIKLHRKLLEWEWYDDLPTFRLFTHMLLKTNYEDKKWRGRVIKAGSFISSIGNLSEETGLTVQQTRTAINKLKSTGELTSQSTNANTLFTLVSWDLYQQEQQADQQTINKRTTNEQQQLKNDKNIRSKEDKNKDIYGDAVESYNSVAEKYGLAKVQHLTAERKSALKARLKECDGLEGWEYALGKIGDSSFLQGKNGKWKADFDFLIKKSKFIKVMEGAYDDGGHSPMKSNSIENQIEEIRQNGW